MSNFQKQKNTLYRNLNSDIISTLKASRAIIAGGAITSIFSEKEINDYDVYFRSYEDIMVFIRNMYNETDYGYLPPRFCMDIPPFTLVCKNSTDRSILFTSNDNTLFIQLIHFSFFEDAHQIFNSFDFSLNMGAFDFATEEFVLHDDFLTDVAGRRINFNRNTNYPIISTLRVQKYLDKGYKISKKDMFKIALAVNNLELSSWEELEDQLSGFYGVDVSKLFDREQPFSLEAAIDMLDLVEEKDYPVYQNTINSLYDIDTMLRKEHNIPAQTIFYKKVQLKNGEISSPHQTHFKWQLGSPVDGGSYGIFCCNTVEQAEEYNVSNGNAIATLEIDDTVTVRMDNAGHMVLVGNVVMTSVRVLESQESKFPAAPIPMPVKTKGDNNGDIPW